MLVCLFVCSFFLALRELFLDEQSTEYEGTNGVSEEELKGGFTLSFDTSN